MSRRLHRGLSIEHFWHGGRTSLQLFVFFAVTVWLGHFVAFVLQTCGAIKWQSVIVEAGVYSVFLIWPVTFYFCPQVFSGEHWRIPANGWKWIGALAGLQLLFVYVQPGVGPVSPYRAISALLFAPLVEEVARAAMIIFLLGRGWPELPSLLLVAFLMAAAHQRLVVSLVMQSALSFLFVYSRKSVLAAVLAHMGMNIVVLANNGVSHLTRGFLG